MKQNKEGWLAAEGRELKAHNRNQSWNLILATEVPVGRRVIRMIWVYKIKRDGTLKARLCVMGNSQRPGVDFKETFSPVANAAALFV